MTKTALIALLAIGFAVPASAQSPLRLTVDEAVRMALANNPDVNADRLGPQISDMRVAAAASAFRPTVSTNLQSSNQLLPPSNFLIPIATRTEVVSTNTGIVHQLPWFGTAYSLSFDTSHTQSNSFLNSYNPLLRSGLSLNVSQPLVRNLFVDGARTELAVSRANRDMADARLRERLIHTTAAVKSAYWNLVSAIATVEARRSALALAQELARVNKAKVDVGASPPLDLVAAQAEVAANQEQLIIAEAAVKQAEDRLRTLVFDPTKREAWTVQIEPIDSPPIATPALDVDAAVAYALDARTDLSRARREIDVARLNASYAANQKLPDVRLNASYQAGGLGGTQVLRAGGFPGTIIGPGAVTSFGSVLDQLFARDYPTWAVGVSVSYPVGGGVEHANDARAKLERAQAGHRLKSAEGRAIQQIREAAWKVEMNARRIDTARATRALAEERLDAERKRLEVGMSTSFLVIQAQRDLAQARTNELSAVLAYDLSLVDFEALQEAPPTPQASQESRTADAAPSPRPQGAPAAGAPRASSAGFTIPGVQQ